MRLPLSAGRASTWPYTTVTIAVTAQLRPGTGDTDFLP